MCSHTVKDVRQFSKDNLTDRQLKLLSALVKGEKIFHVRASDHWSVNTWLDQILFGNEREVWSDSDVEKTVYTFIDESSGLWTEFTQCRLPESTRKIVFNRRTGTFDVTTLSEDTINDSSSTVPEVITTVYGCSSGPEAIFSEYRDKQDDVFIQLDADMNPVAFGKIRAGD